MYLIYKMYELKVLYGVEGKYLDITDNLKYFGDNYLIIIPQGDCLRTKFFDVNDPAPGILKHIKLICNGKEEILNDKIYREIDSSVYSNLAKNNCYKSIDNIPEISIKLKYHDKLKLKYGSWNGELPEQLLSLKYISSDLKVLELGGNIGRNSMIIASLLENQKNLVTIEPNPDIFKQLKENRDSNNLVFNIEESAVSKRRLWSKKWYTFDSEVPGSKEVKTISFGDIEKKYDLVFDTLVVDCEGALYYILKDDPTILKNINLILIENDFSSNDHKKWVDEQFKYYGLERIYNQNLGSRRDFYEVWEKDKLDR